MAKRIIYLLCLSGVFSLVPRVFADITMYSDVNGICPGYCKSIPSNGRCCSQNDIVKTITPPTRSGQIFVGYMPLSNDLDSGIDSLVVSSTGKVKSDVRSLDANTLYAIWTPECNPGEEQNLAVCDVAKDSAGDVLLVDGEVLYSTKCSSGYTYDDNTNPNSASATCHESSDQTPEAECSQDNPEYCTQNQCLANLSRYGYYWCWVDGGEKCYLPQNNETSCCASLPAGNCTSSQSCESMGFVWENNVCKKKVVYYACGVDQPKVTGYETPVRDGMFLPQSINTVCSRLASQDGYEFTGWKVRETGAILSSSTGRQQYIWNTSSVILEAQWNTCDAEHPQLCMTQQTCESDNKYWCTDPTVYTQNWTWSCSENVGTQCCYNSPENCEYLQCQRMGYVWVLNDDPESAHCAVSGPDYVQYKFHTYTGSADAGKLGDYLIAKGVGTGVGSRIRKQKGVNESKIYLLSDWAPDSTSWGYYRSLKPYTKLTRNPYLPGHTFRGMFDSENGAGTQHIDANGNVKTVALNADTDLYPHFTEDDTTEPSNGLIKLYLSACQTGDYCGTFTNFTDGTPIPNDDPLLHQKKYYGPIYYSGNISQYNNSTDKFYTDASGTIELTHGLPSLAGSEYYTFKGWMVRDQSFYASDYEFMSGARHYDMFTFGSNNNRSIIYPVFDKYGPYWYTQNDCGTGGTYAGIGAYASSAYSESTVNRVCNDAGRGTAVYYGEMLNISDTDYIPRCQCVRPGCKISGWKLSGTDETFVHGQPKLWNHKSGGRFVAQWDCSGN